MKSYKLLAIILIGCIILIIGILNILNLRENSKQSTKPSTQPQISIVNNSSRSDDEKILLTGLPPNPSQQDTANLINAAVRLAQASDTLTIKNCLGAPMALKIQLDQPLTIKNLDPSDHTIIMYKDQIFAVPAYGSKTIPARFGKGSGNGVFTYRCDDTYVSGRIFVTTR